MRRQPLDCGSIMSVEYPHLQRLDGNGLSGWQLRLPAWHPLGPNTQYYADSIFGGADQALAAAIRERDRLFDDAGLSLRQNGHIHPGARNNSGIPGIRLKRMEAGKRRGGYRWVADWMQDSRQVRRYFSISVHGLEGGLKSAIEARAKATGIVPSEAQYLSALTIGLSILAGRADDESTHPASAQPQDARPERRSVKSAGLPR